MALKDVDADGAVTAPVPGAAPGSSGQSEEETHYAPVLESVAKPASSAQPVPEVPHEPPPPDLTRGIAAIEVAMGSSPAEARIKTDQTAGMREASLLEGKLPMLPALSPSELLREVEALTVLVEDIARRPAPGVLAAK